MGMAVDMVVKDMEAVASDVATAMLDSRAVAAVAAQSVLAGAMNLVIASSISSKDVVEVMDKQD